MKLGRFFVYFNHAATINQIVGTEFVYDWASKKVAAKVGVSQKFNDSTSGKFKVDQDGRVDAVLKHKYNETVTASLATGFNFSQLVNDSKTKAFPVGLAFDFKF
jgi:Eukaryotic porin